MRLLKLLLLLGLFIAMFLWVKSAEDEINRKSCFEAETKFSKGDSIKCDSLRKPQALQYDLRPR
jgi:hypothetical protein